MSVAQELRDALNRLCGLSPIEVWENGHRLATLADVQFEVIARETEPLLHLWAEERNLVRRVLRLAGEAPDCLTLEIRQFGRRQPGRLELVRVAKSSGASSRTRQEFADRFRELLMQQFPDEKIETFSGSADLEHSLSGCYVRGLLHRGAQAWAVIGAGDREEQAVIDGILTFGLVWLDSCRRKPQGKHVAGLRVFVPEEGSRVSKHRLQALSPLVHVELFEVTADTGRCRSVDRKDVGNLETYLTPRRELEYTLAEARPLAERIRALAPDAIGVGTPPGTRDVAFRFRGIEMARWQRGKVMFGAGDDRKELCEGNWKELVRLVRELDKFRHPFAADLTHPLYRAQAEGWLEAMVQGDPQRIHPHLDATRLYSQVPAFAGGDRGVIDLLGVTQDGRLAVIELKASEDIHLPMQAVDYWLRVRWHQRQDDYQRYGYFPGIQLQEKAPLLFLIAPSLRFHPATDTILRYLSPEIDVTRIGVNESWRQGMSVVFRM